MLARIRKAQENGEGGFTLIELLVVMIIIGILAAIAIPVFLNQRKKAQDSAAKADVTTIGKEIATYYVDHCLTPTVAASAGGRYTLSSTAGSPASCTNDTAISGQDLGRQSNNVVLGTQFASLTGNFADATHWCVDVNNAQGSQQTFKYSAKGGLSTGTCVAADVS